MADDPTAPAGQEGGSPDAGLYDLDGVTPEIREHLEPHLKAIEGNVTRKFQEAAQYRQGWAPYEQMGLQNVPPETVGELLAFSQLVEEPEQFDQWLVERAQERGLFGSGQEDLDAGMEDLSAEKVQELIAQQMSQALSPIQEQLQAQQQERQVQEANSEISQQLEQIRADHQGLPEDAEDTIVRLAYSYADEDPDGAIQKGFEDYQKLIGQGEKGLFDKKTAQPQTPEGPGAAATSPEPVSSFGDARLKQMATERLHKSLSG